MVFSTRAEALVQDRPKIGGAIVGDPQVRHAVLNFAGPNQKLT
jgi:hypothetical protein